jgi:hypothetical protein
MAPACEVRRRQHQNTCGKSQNQHDPDDQRISAVRPALTRRTAAPAAVEGRGKGLDHGCRREPNVAGKRSSTAGLAPNSIAPSREPMRKPCKCIANLTNAGRTSLRSALRTPSFAPRRPVGAGNGNYVLFAQRDAFYNKNALYKSLTSFRDDLSCPRRNAGAIASRTAKKGRAPPRSGSEGDDHQGGVRVTGRSPCRRARGRAGSIGDGCAGPSAVRPP